MSEEHANPDEAESQAEAQPTEPQDDLTAAAPEGSDRAMDEATEVSVRHRHGFSVEEARTQHRLLFTVAAESPIRQTRYEMRRRGREWHRAANVLEEWEDEGYTIELVGQVEAGMQLPGNELPLEVVRRMVQHGQTTLHVEDPADGRPIYLNYHGSSSPVVVKR